MLYATSFDGNIHSIHPSTGATTALTNVTTPDIKHYYDLVELNGSIFTVGFINTNQAQYTIHRFDPTSNGGLTATQISNTAVTANPSPLFVQDGQLYGYNGVNQLVSINTTTGAITTVQTISEIQNPGDASYGANATVTGNVLTNDTGAQTVTTIQDINGNPVTVTTSGVTVETAFGELSIRSDGSYTYTLNNSTEQVDNLSTNETANDRFVYTTTNTSNTSAQAVLTVHINGADELKVIENSIEGDGLNNILIGGTENDSIIGGGGNDTLTGGRGVDFFVWKDGNEGTTTTPAVDTITDFSVGSQGDILHLVDLLPSTANSSNLDEYLSFNSSDGTTTIDVSTTANGEAVQQIVLDDVDLTVIYGTSDTTSLINNLTNDGNLIT